jgi:hypothetical protein
MKTLLSLILAVLMTLTPVLAALDVTPAAAQDGQHGALRIPIATTSGLPATLTITRFVEQDGEAVAVGTVTGTTADGRTVITPVALNVLRGGAAAAGAQAAPAAQAAQVTQQATCDILNLVLAPLHLDLLGLVVDLPNPLVINIFAESGPGNLLGNLLCAITGLLDGTGAAGQLVAALNRMLGALGG